MGIEHAYSAVRVVLIVVYTAATLLLTRSQMIAFVSDYGWPWRRRPGANGRSAVDLRAILFTAGFAVLGLMACATALRRLLVIGPYPLSADSVMVTAFLAYMAWVAGDLWIRARRERLNYGKPKHRTDVQ